MGKIFVSYSRTDAGAALDISRALSQAGLEPWLDTVEIGPGESFLERMNEALREASYVLVLLSSASVRSRWVTREWMSAMAGGRTAIVPVLLEDVELPPLLRDILHIDFRSRPQGTEQLLSFFRKELYPLNATEPASPPRRGVSSDLMRTLTAREIRLIAVACLTNEALSAFLIDAQLDPGDIHGTSANEKVLSLLHRIQRDGVVVSFTEWLALEQPRCFERNLAKVRAQQRWELGPDQIPG